jgi:hypothetical protein
MAWATLLGQAKSNLQDGTGRWGYYFRTVRLLRQDRHI